MKSSDRNGDRVSTIQSGVLAVCATALALAFIGAWMRPVWHDELYTLMLSRMPVGELVSALVVDSGPPLHYLLCHLLFAIIGWQEGSLLGAMMVRLPSVLAFASIPLVVWRARPRGDSEFPWAPLIVISWLPLLYFGTEARAYALLALINAVVWVCGPAWIERGGWRTVLFGALAATLPMLHYAGAASLLALPALYLFVPRPRWRALTIALVAAVLPLVAWLPVMWGAPRASMGWVETATGPGRPGMATVGVIAPAGPFPALFESSSAPVPPWASISILFALALAVAVGARLLWRRSSASGFELRCAARLGIGLMPAAGLSVAALAGVPLYFAGRTESMVWALAAALVTILSLGLPSAGRRTALGAYLVVGMATVLMWLVDLPQRPPPAGIEVGRELAARVVSGDRVVVAGLWQLEVRRGLAEGGLAGRTSDVALPDVETVPRSQALHPGWLDREAVASPALIEEARELRRSAGLAGERIWLVWSPGLPLETHFFPAFSGWQRRRVAGSPIIAVDLLSPPVAEEVPSSQGEGAQT
jgi:hypothetical protein